MNTIRRFSAIFALSLLPMAAFAGEVSSLEASDAALSAVHAEGNSLLAISGKAKSADMISLDIMSDGTATGFQFSIPVSPAGRSAAKGMDLSKCVADIPSTHTGHCAYRPNKSDVVVIVYSLENTLLPEGIVGVGAVRVPGVVAKSLDSIKPVFVSSSGKQL